MHGVGGHLLGGLLREAGHHDLHAVSEQADPDPDFPTVRFPNPEEAGALDLLHAQAARVDADLALATDPDADRVAVAVPIGDGPWRTLTGDEVGALLAEGLLEHGSGADRLLVTSVVSSQLLACIAAGAGVRFEETLTGFKWLCRPAIAHPEWRQVLAYEEAIGYAIGPQTRDKDGLTAALAVAHLARADRRDGRTLLHRLDGLAARHGAHVTDNRAYRLSGAGGQRRGAAVAARIGSAPPPSVGGLRIDHVTTPLRTSYVCTLTAVTV